MTTIQQKPYPKPPRTAPSSTGRRRRPFPSKMYQPVQQVEFRDFFGLRPQFQPSVFSRPRTSRTVAMSTLYAAATAGGESDPDYANRVSDGTEAMDAARLVFRPKDDVLSTGGLGQLWKPFEDQQREEIGFTGQKLRPNQKWNRSEVPGLPLPNVTPNPVIDFYKALRPPMRRRKVEYGAGFGGGFNDYRKQKTFEDPWKRQRGRRRPEYVKLTTPKVASWRSGPPSNGWLCENEKDRRATGSLKGWFELGNW